MLHSLIISEILHENKMKNKHHVTPFSSSFLLFKALTCDKWLFVDAFPQLMLL